MASGGGKPRTMCWQARLGAWGWRFKVRFGGWGSPRGSEIGEVSQHGGMGAGAPGFEESYTARLRSKQALSVAMVMPVAAPGTGVGGGCWGRPVTRY